MKAITLKPIKYSVPVILIIFAAILYFYKTPILKQANTLKCPESYQENEIGTTEYRNAMIDWTSEFFKANPKATISDWSIAKSKLWEDNKCISAIERSKMSGEVVDLKPWELVDYEVQNTLNKTINSTN
jgi:uncharacterized protein YxeA